MFLILNEYIENVSSFISSLNFQERLTLFATVVCPIIAILYPVIKDYVTTRKENLKCRILTNK